MKLKMALTVVLLLEMIIRTSSDSNEASKPASSMRWTDSDLNYANENNEKNLGAGRHAGVYLQNMHL